MANKNWQTGIVLLGVAEYGVVYRLPGGKIWNLATERFETVAKAEAMAKLLAKR